MTVAELYEKLVEEGFVVEPARMMRGFTVRLGKNRVVSVSYDKGNYCSNRFEPYALDAPYIENAEIALIDTSGRHDRYAPIAGHRGGTVGWESCEHIQARIKSWAKRYGKGVA